MLISIIVPVYNVEEYIIKSVRSIQNQQYSNIEIILVDDGSTDNSGLVCDSLATEDNRIKVIHKDNGGASDARNAGLDVAQGEYIGFVDADDCIDSKMYADLYNLITEYDADMISCGYTLDTDVDSTELFTQADRPTLFDAKGAFHSFLLKEYIDISVYTKLFKKEVIGKQRFKKGIHTEDLLFVYEYIKKVNRIVSIGKTYYHIYCREGSSSRVKRNPHVLDPLSTVTEVRDYIYDNYDDMKDEADNFYYLWIYEVYNTLLNNEYHDDYKRERREIRNIFLKSFKKCMDNPFIDKTYKFLYLGVVCRCPRLARGILDNWFNIKKRVR